MKVFTCVMMVVWLLVSGEQGTRCGLQPGMVGILTDTPSIDMRRRCPWANALGPQTLRMPAIFARAMGRCSGPQILRIFFRVLVQASLLANVARAMGRCSGPQIFAYFLPGILSGLALGKVAPDMGQCDGSTDFTRVGNFAILYCLHAPSPQIQARSAS